MLIGYALRDATEMEQDRAIVRLAFDVGLESRWAGGGVAQGTLSAAVAPQLKKRRSVDGRARRRGARLDPGAGCALAARFAWDRDRRAAQRVSAQGGDGRAAAERRARIGRGGRPPRRSVVGAEAAAGRGT